MWCSQAFGTEIATPVQIQEIGASLFEVRVELCLWWYRCIWYILFKPKYDNPDRFLQASHRRKSVHCLRSPQLSGSSFRRWKWLQSFFGYKWLFPGKLHLNHHHTFFNFVWRKVTNLKKLKNYWHQIQNTISLPNYLFGKFVYFFL